MMMHVERITPIINSMLKPILCDYSDVYILANETITVAALTAGGWNNSMQLV